MKDKSIIKSYLKRRENYNVDGILIGVTLVGAVLFLMFVMFYVGIGFLGLPLMLIGGGGLMFLKSSRITDEDYEEEVKRLMDINKIEETPMTLKEYIIGKSELIKRGRDKRIRTAFLSIVTFTLKNDVYTAKKYVLDLVSETSTVEEFKVNAGTEHSLTEKSYDTSIGEVKSSWLSFGDDPTFTFPVNMNVYDTDAAIKAITHKR